MLALNYQFFGAADYANRDRFFAKLAAGKLLSIYREFNLYVKPDAARLNDKLAAMSGMVVTQFDDNFTTLENDDDLVQVYFSKQKLYATALVKIWTSSASRAENIRANLNKQVAELTLKEPFFCIDWCFQERDGAIGSVLLDESADLPLIDCAYPSIIGGIKAFIDRYLAADEPILILHGPPGTGKTRLVRAILSEISHRVGNDCRIMFASDDLLMKRDEIFMRFIKHGHEAFVIEDADHLLKPRNDGNVSLHRILTISDGVVRAQGRKIIFTSNLPNLGDLDDALLRPGRCFACLNLPRLGKGDVEKLLAALHDDPIDSDAAKNALFSADAKYFSLAEVYRSASNSPQTRSPVPTADFEG